MAKGHLSLSLLSHYDHKMKKREVPYVLRQFRNDDLASLHHMIEGTIDISYSGVYPPRAVQYFKEYHSKSKIMERSQLGEIWLIESKGILVATGALVGNEILGVFVKPEDQGQGFGKEIMGRLERRAREKGFSEVILSVSLPSRKFYEKLGYEVLEKSSFDVCGGQYLEYWPARKALAT